MTLSLLEMLTAAFVVINILVFIDGLSELFTGHLSYFGLLLDSLIRDNYRIAYSMLLSFCFIGYTMYYLAIVVHTKCIILLMHHTEKKLAESEKELAEINRQISELEALKSEVENQQ